MKFDLGSNHTKQVLPIIPANFASKKLKMLSLSQKAKLFAAKTYFNALSYLNAEKAGEKSYKLFAKPRKGAITAEQEIFLATSERSSLEYDGHIIPIYCWKNENPNAKSVLLAHGWESNAARWQPLSPYLQKLGVTIYALDALAHGAAAHDDENKYFSAVQYGLNLRETLKRIQPHFIIGHSAGGYAVTYALSDQTFDNLQKVILLAPSSDSRSFFNLYLNYLSYNDRVKKAYYKYVEDLVGDLEKLTGQYLAKNIKIPALIIHDINDDVVSYKQSELLHAAWKNSTLHLTNGIGHRMRDEKIYEEIIKYLV